MSPYFSKMCLTVPSLQFKRCFASRCFSFVAALFTVVIAMPAQGQSALKVMPLGDSITRGSNAAGAVPGGYRKQLGARITGAGRSLDFVGNRSDNPAVGMDPHHNGRDGWRTDQVLGALTNDLKANPEVVVMHLGTNDLLQAVPTSTVITNMTTLIQRITSHSSSPRLYVATIIPILQDRNGKTRSQWTIIVNDYNSQVRQLVQQQAGLGRKVNLVDMAAELDFTIGTASTNFYHPTDGTHPNQNGYNKMGDFWFDALQAGGSIGTTPPPPTTATNLALGKPSSASTTYSGDFGPGKANDGRTDNIWSALSNDTTASWTVDLGNSYRIETVEVVTRQNIDQDLTRRNFEIRGSVTPDFLNYEVLGAQGSTTLPFKSTFTATVTNTNAFRYIRVAKTDGLYFTIAETRVFGTAPTGETPTVTLGVTASTNTALNVAVSPSDLDGAGNGSTSFSRRYHAGTSVTITAPPSSDSATFVKWQRNGADLTTNATATLTLNSSMTVHAVYAISPPPPPPPPTGNTAFVNGSFEGGYTGWSASGSQAIRTHSSYLPTNGQSVVVFNGNNETPNGVITQSFQTIPGVTYGVAFDVGVLSYNSSQQKIEVRATGTGTLLSQTLTRTGSGNGVPKWTSHSYNFTANSTATTLTFSDRSAATKALDMLLDNVRVTGGSPPLNTAPVANADSYSSLSGSPVSVPAPGVLGNDSDSQSNPLTAVLVSNVSNGSLSLNPNGSFTYQPDSGYVGTDSFTYKANDGSLDSVLATVSIIVRAESLAGLANGGFESDLADWTASGAVDLKSAVPYVASSGGKLVAFNAANQAPNGSLSQAFATTEGETYQLQFDLGVLSYNTQYQKIRVSVTGAEALFSREITIRGAGGGSNRWFPQSFTFVADSGSTTLTFQDKSTTTSNLDLLLDHVRVTPASAIEMAASLAVLPPPVLPGKVSISGLPGDLNIQMSADQPGTYFLESSPDLKDWTLVIGSEQILTEPSMLSFKDLKPKSEENGRTFYRVGFHANN
jgi:lysophospholipase L1-like esterase